MTLRIVEEVPAGNIVAGAWSRAGLLAVVMRSGWRGPLRGFVVDPSASFRLLASFPVPWIEPQGVSLLVAFPDDQPDVVVTTDGRTASRWHARTGALLIARDLLDEGEHGRSFAVLHDGRVLVRAFRSDGVTTHYQLRLVDLVSGERTTKPAAWADLDLVLPLGHRDEDYVGLTFVNTKVGSQISRLGAKGPAVWQVVIPGYVARISVALRGVVVIKNGPTEAQIYDAEEGKKRSTLTSSDGFADAGIDGSGGLFTIEGHGNYTAYDARGKQVHALTLDRLVQGLDRSDDGRLGLLSVDRMNLESEAHVVDLTTGDTLWKTRRSFGPAVADRAHGALWIGGNGGLVRVDEADGSSARVHGKPVAALAVAREAGLAVFASANKVFVVDAAGQDKPRAIDKYFGEPRLAISLDGKRALLLEESSVRLLDLAAGKRLFAHDHEAIEEETIDPPDDVFFGADEEPYVAHCGVATKLSAKQIGGAGPLPAKDDRPLRVEVGLDETVSIVDRQGQPRLRIHLAPNGKAGLVENGRTIDWLGPPAHAKTARGIRLEGEPVRGKALEALRTEGLVARTFAAERGSASLSRDG